VDYDSYSAEGDQNLNPNPNPNSNPSSNPSNKPINHRGDDSDYNPDLNTKGSIELDELESVKNGKNPKPSPNSKVIKGDEADLHLKPESNQRLTDIPPTLLDSIGLSILSAHDKKSKKIQKKSATATKLRRKLSEVNQLSASRLGSKLGSRAVFGIGSRAKIGTEIDPICHGKACFCGCRKVIISIGMEVLRS
jgi:hypothetical protein